MDNLNLILLSGGYYHCTPEWNAAISGKDNCYKLYFPIEGNANLKVNGEWYELTAGNAYFINGFMLEEQNCNDFMDVYWLHFTPESDFLSMNINSFKGIYSWKHSSKLLNNIDLGKIPLLFDDPYQEENKLLNMASLSMTCYISSIVLMFLSDMLDNQKAGFCNMSYDLYLKLEPAVDFINKNYFKNLRLDEIAQQIYLNPIYFLRLFKKCYKMTPSHYVTIKRLNEACRLLTRTDLSIKEISENTGFCNQFYFSKVFKSHFNKTPFEYRSKKLSP